MNLGTGMFFLLVSCLSLSLGIQIQKSKSLNKMRAEIQKRLETKIDEMRKEIEAGVEKRIEDMKTSLVESTETPYAAVCFYAETRSNIVGAITYDRILSEYYNSVRRSDNLGDFRYNITQGLYTVIKPSGLYTITFSGLVEVKSGRFVGGGKGFMDIFLAKNENMVFGSKWTSDHQAFADNPIQTMGSRTVIIELKPGDKLQILANSNNAVLKDFIFCVSVTVPFADRRQQ